MLLATLLCLLAPGGGTAALADAPASFPAWLLPLEGRNVVSDNQIQPIGSLAGRTFVAACCLRLHKHPGFPLKIASRFL